MASVSSATTTEASVCPGAGLWVQRISSTLPSSSTGGSILGDPPVAPWKRQTTLSSPPAKNTPPSGSKATAFWSRSIVKMRVREPVIGVSAMPFTSRMKGFVENSFWCDAIEWMTASSPSLA